MFESAQGDSAERMLHRSWDSLCRRNAEVAVSTPVLDLAPGRKFNRELQKSMSFSNWTPEEADHPLVCRADLPRKSQSDETKRASSPTDSEKAKLDDLRKAVKDDLRRFIMKRTHSPDSASARKSAFMRQKTLTALQKPDDIADCGTDDLVSPASMEEMDSPWHDGDGLNLSDDELLLEDYDSLSDYESIDSFVSPASADYLDKAWSNHYLDDSSDGAESKELQRMMTKSRDLDSYGYYNTKPAVPTEGGRVDLVCRSLIVLVASFIAYSKISVPAPAKSVDSDREIIDEEPFFPIRLREGILEAGKKVLSSVWTWAVVAIVFAGVKLNSAYSSPREEEDSTPRVNYWVESKKLAFDWDDDVEFKFHHPTRN